MPTRTLKSETDNTRTYDVFNDAGEWIGVDTESRVDQTEINRQTLRERARQAITKNNEFLALAAPTNAQTLAQVKLLTRECSALIRLVLEDLGTTDGA